MKPKAKKFRIRRIAPSTGARAPREKGATAQTPTDPAISADLSAQSDGTGSGLARPAPEGAKANGGDPALTGQVSSSSERSAEDTMVAIRREGLMGRQLRVGKNTICQPSRF